jgi:hypothetical protein
LLLGGDSTEREDDDNVPSVRLIVSGSNSQQFT